MRKTILHLICTTPKVYSGFDRFNLVLCKELSHKGYLSICVFLDEIKPTAIIEDLLSDGAIIEILSTKNGTLKLYWQICKVYIKYKPSIIHVHFVEKIKLFVSIIKCFSNVKYLFSIHSMITSLSPNEYRKQKGIIKLCLLKIYLKYEILSAAKVFCISSAIENQLRDFTKSNSLDIKRLSLGIKIQTPLFDRSMHRKQNGGFALNTALVLNIGAIEYLKGIETLLLAIIYLKKEFPLLNFFVIHIGGLREETNENIKYFQFLQELITKNGIGENFRFLGQSNDIVQLLPLFDIYVHPSLSEGLGVSIMEACAAGLPIIASRTGGIPEIVKNNYNGFLIEPGNDVELALNLEELISNPELRYKMGKNSKKIVTEEYNVSIQVKKYIEEYTSLFDKSK